MKNSAFWRLIVPLAILLLISGCGTSGEVVKVTTIQNARDLNGLGKAEREKLQEIRKARNTPGIDESLSNVIEATTHFSVADYLATHREARGAVGGDYMVGGYDVLSIIVYEEKDLTRDAVRVSSDGYITFPLIGRLEVNKLNTSEIEKLISLKLAEQQYLLDAHVSVMVTEYHSKRFLALGAVKTPGSYPLKARECVLDGISRAGGINPEQAGKRGMIIRTDQPNSPKERKIVIDLDLPGLLKGKDQISNVYLVDKDVIFIPTAEYFYIIGQVKKPGSYPLTDREISLVEAISMAEGFTNVAARNKTRIIRVEDGVEKIIEVQVDAITDAGKKIQDVLIRPNDVIVVPESFF